MCLAPTHWVILGLVMKRSVAVARVLLLPFGVLPFLVVGIAPAYVGVDPQYMNIMLGYLFVFGVCLCVYLFGSKEVQRYVETQRRA